jgi:hypothetical protein
MAKPKPHETHRQCKLRKGNRITYSWIPSKYATRGKYLELKDDDGQWENGWQVDEVWGERKSIDVIKNADGYKKQRKRTDSYRDEDGLRTTPTG